MDEAGVVITIELSIETVSEERPGRNCTRDYVKICVFPLMLHAFYAYAWKQDSA